MDIDFNKKRVKGNNKISNESPLGKALIGCKVGEIVDVETQAGISQYEILDIQRNVEE